jgi:NAD(P)-dependent dehydrogenase (short-subunit alcohol dehydrogenase family)
MTTTSTGPGWTVGDIPGQDGRRAVVTGANSGIGWHTARQLAKAGAAVVLGCRDATRGRQAVERLRAAVPDAELELRALDLADLDSVGRFAADVAEAGGVDLLVNNAGVMAVPERHTSAQGYELQFATNHLGHFALTGLLLPSLLAAKGARVVTVSSGAHLFGRIRFDDLQGERTYRPWRAYSQSKLANLLFARELDRRLRNAGSDAISTAAHPGFASTNLQSSGPLLGGGGPLHKVMAKVSPYIGQSDAVGAVPTLFAATAPEATGGAYYGPAGFGGNWGAYPALTRPGARAFDDHTARRLWSVSEELTGVRFEALPS